VILGSLCGLKNVSQISQWAENERVREFLAEYFGIKKVPCYYWILCLLKIIDPVSLNKCMMSWVQSLLLDGHKDYTISFDGKTICSTAKMQRYKKPIHIVSAHIAELGITLASHKVDGKTNEIPALRELLSILNLEGYMIVADAMHCQKETAAAIVDKNADYLLCAKDNQSSLKNDIEDYVQDSDLQKSMDKAHTHEQNGGRIELRRAFVCTDIDWLHDKTKWKNIKTIGAINRQTTYKGKTTNEWHYYISSRKLTPQKLLHHARLEWSIESMHWLLDVHFHEDFCRVEDETTQQILNIVRKIALNCIKTYKQRTGSKLPLSKIMFGCLLDSKRLVGILENDGN
jgi:predicted transposase YbfD/YdcC